MLKLESVSVGTKVKQIKYAPEYTVPGETYEVVSIQYKTKKCGRVFAVWVRGNHGQTFVSPFFFKTCFEIVPN